MARRSARSRTSASVWPMTLCEVDIGRIELHAAGLDLRQVEDVVDEREQVASRVARCLRRTRPACRSCRRTGAPISTSEKPMIAFSGVRSSCDMLARNSLLCRLARSSSRLLISISRNSRAFWIAMADCVANVFRSSITLGSKVPAILPIHRRVRPGGDPRAVTGPRAASGTRCARASRARGSGTCSRRRRRETAPAGR